VAKHNQLRTQVAKGAQAAKGGALLPAASDMNEVNFTFI